MTFVPISVSKTPVPVSQRPVPVSQRPFEWPIERHECLFERDEYPFEQFKEFMLRVNMKLQEHNRVRAILIKQEKHLRILGRKQDQKAQVQRHHVAERRITHGNHTQQLKQPDKRR